MYLYTGSVTDCNDYTLNINVMQDPCLTAPDDGLEQNDDCPSAVTIGAGSTTGLIVFNGDDDYYRITCPQDNYINVDAIFTHVPTSGDIDIELYDDVSCTNLVDSGNTGSSDESVSVNNQTGAAADYILRVYGNGSGFSCNTYGLNVTFVPDPCANPVDDSFEQNDDCVNAAALGAGATTGLITFQGDDDYYRVTVPAGNILTVDALFTHVSGTGDIDMELFDDVGVCGNQVDASASEPAPSAQPVAQSAAQPAAPKITADAAVYEFGGIKPSDSALRSRVLR